MAGGIEFDRGKFKELVLYLSQASAEDERFGMVKLNKLLYRADFEAFRRLGRPITGERYQKEEWGPIAHDLLPVLDELARAGRLIVASLPAGPLTRHVPKPHEDPEYGRADETVFTEDEREVIEDTLKELAVYGGKGVSEWSHEESVGWRLSKTGTEIPYETSVIASEPAPLATVARLRDRVLSGNWE